MISGGLVGPNRPHERVTHGGSETRAWESADGMGVFYKQGPRAIHRCTFSRCRVARRARSFLVWHIRGFQSCRVVSTMCPASPTAVSIVTCPSAF